MVLLFLVHYCNVFLFWILYFIWACRFPIMHPSLILFFLVISSFSISSILSDFPFVIFIYSRTILFMGLFYNSPTYSSILQFLLFEAPYSLQYYFYKIYYGIFFHIFGICFVFFLRWFLLRYCYTAYFLHTIFFNDENLRSVVV